MNSSPVPESSVQAPLPLEDYTWHWVLLGLFVAAVGSYGWWRYNNPAVVDSKLPSELQGQADGYWIVRIPEVTGRSAQRDIAKKRMHHWLTTFREEGMRPLLLSEAQERFRRGQGIPENSLVLLFDPGYRQTYQVLAPVLRELQWPAVWSTPRAALERGDPRYVSLHETKKMQRSGFWDVIQNEPPGASLVSRSAGKIAWNPLTEEGPAHYLNADATWTKQELIDRLLAERPLREKSYLILRKIQAQEWGIVEPLASSPPNPGFPFIASLDKRGTWLSWSGTRGRRNLELDMQISSLTGELWAVFRSDEKLGEGVRVAFANGRLMVEEERAHTRRVAFSASVPALKQPSTFRALITLDGPLLRIAINSGSSWTVSSLSPPESREGVFRLMIYDKITGAAGADSVKLVATPLPH